MFSFSSLAVFTTVAFSALTSAIPLGTPAGDLPLPDISAVTGIASGLPVDPSVATGAVSGLPIVGGLLPRADVPPSVAVILTTVTAKLVPATNALAFVNAHNATADHLSAPVGEIKDILTGAVSALQALVGQPTEVILASVDGTVQITVQELGKLVGGLLVIVFHALGAVLKVVGGTVEPAVHDLLVTVGVLVALVLSTVLTLVGGIVGELLGVVVPLLADVIPFIMHLNLATIISLLKL